MARHPERLALLGRHNEAEILTRIGSSGHFWANHRLSVFILIFFRHVILRHLVCMDLPLLIVLCIFDTLHDAGLERIPFLEQLVDTFRISAFSVAQPL